MSVDYVIVGSGLTGATIARILHDAGTKIVVVERRDHLGGNVHDFIHSSGIRINAYGPHYFRTSSERVWQFVNRFAEFYSFAATLMSQIDGHCEHWPVQEEYIRRVAGENWQPSFRGKAANFEEAALSMMPETIYKEFVKGYTEKQWGVCATALSARLAGRFEIRANGDVRLKRHKYQGLPVDGYAVMMRRMLEGIPVLLNCDYLACRDEFHASAMTIFTGAIDEYFGFDLGRLAYRGQQRIHEYYRDVDYFQRCGQINNPNPLKGAHIRTLEWKHMMQPEKACKTHGTVITREIPYTPDDPGHYEYPFPDQRNAKLYREYRRRASEFRNLFVCGRLGEYRYLDMDQAIARAMIHADRILQQRNGCFRVAMSCT